MNKKMDNLPNGWTVQQLGDVLETPLSGFSALGEDRPAGPGECGVLKLSAVAEGRFFPDQNKAVRGSETEKLKVSVAADSILVSRSNTEALVGAVAYVEKDHPTLFLPDLLWSLKAKAGVDVSLRWLSGALASSVYRPEIVRQASGTSASMKKLTKPNFLSIRIAFPTVREQHAMATILNTWDRAIQQLEQLLHWYRLRRKAVSDSLITGQRRFREYIPDGASGLSEAPAGWDDTTIGAVADDVTERNASGRGLPVLSCSKYDGLVESLQYFGKQVFSDDTSNYKIVTRGQFAYPSNHIEEGSIGLLDCVDVGLVSPIYTVFSTRERVFAPFLFKVLKTDRYRRVFKMGTSASVDRRGSLRWKEFSNIRIQLPPLHEQEKISACVDTLDTEIALMSTQLGRFKAQKQALVRKLITGEIRVPLNQEV